MKQVTVLTDEQIREYKEQGWIVLPSVFSRKEINVLNKSNLFSDIKVQYNDNKYIITVKEFPNISKFYFKKNNYQ